MDLDRKGRYYWIYFHKTFNMVIVSLVMNFVINSISTVAKIVSDFSHALEHVLNCFLTCWGVAPPCVDSEYPLDSHNLYDSTCSLYFSS